MNTFKLKTFYNRSFIVASFRMTVMRCNRRTFLSFARSNAFSDRLLPKYFEYAEIFNYHYLMLLVSIFLSLRLPAQFTICHVGFFFGIYIPISESSHMYIESQIEFVVCFFWNDKLLPLKMAIWNWISHETSWSILIFGKKNWWIEHYCQGKKYRIINGMVEKNQNSVGISHTCYWKSNHLAIMQSVSIHLFN